jgi:hypothetical protein
MEQYCCQGGPSVTYAYAADGTLFSCPLQVSFTEFNVLPIGMKTVTIMAEGDEYDEEQLFACCPSGTIACGAYCMPTQYGCWWIGIGFVYGLVKPQTNPTTCFPVSPSSCVANATLPNGAGCCLPDSVARLAPPSDAGTTTTTAACCATETLDTPLLLDQATNELAFCPSTMVFYKNNNPSFPSIMSANVVMDHTLWGGTDGTLVCCPVGYTACGGGCFSPNSWPCSLFADTYNPTQTPKQCYTPVN